MLHGLVGFFVDIVCCRWNMGKYSKLKKEENNLPPQSVPTTLGANDISPSPVQGVSLLSQDTASLLAETFGSHKCSAANTCGTYDTSYRLTSCHSSRYFIGNMKHCTRICIMTTSSSTDKVICIANVWIFKTR